MKKKSFIIGFLIATSSMGLAACNQQNHEASSSFSSSSSEVSSQGELSSSDVSTGEESTAEESTGVESTGEESSSEESTGEDVEAGKIVMNDKEYDSIKSALGAISENDTNTYVIKLGKGTYAENGLTCKAQQQ